MSDSQAQVDEGHFDMLLGLIMQDANRVAMDEPMCFPCSPEHRRRVVQLALEKIEPMLRRCYRRQGRLAAELALTAGINRVWPEDDPFPDLMHFGSTPKWPAT